MTDTYAAEILADSLSPDGVRLTTMWVTFPRFILAEVNTHRMLSRNSNSSRAIPPERQIQRVRDKPFVPETFNKRVKGMGVGEALEQREMERARAHWLAASQFAADQAENLLNLDCDKSRINRLLEPFLWHSAVITATEWDNFFALRDHPAAQPEFQIVAKMMREAMELSTPAQLDYGMWHLPGLAAGELARLRATREAAQASHGGDAEEATRYCKLISAGRLAKWTSYDKMSEEDLPDAAVARASKLIGSFHMSPTEHQARPMNKAELKQGEIYRTLLLDWRDNGAKVPDWMIERTHFCGNFRGWVQFRKEIPNEHNAALALNLS